MSGGLKLAGIHVFWTGLRESGDAIIDALEREGAVVERRPLLSCIPVQKIAPLPLIRPDTWMVFTSARAVEAVFGLGLNLSTAKIAAVGPATANKLLEKGFAADLVPDDMRAEGLAAAMVERTRPPSDVIFFRGDKVLTTLPDRLCKAGFRVEERIVYTTVPIPIEDARQIASRILSKAEVAILGSPSGVQVLEAATSLSALSKAAPNILFAALGPTTEAALKAAGVEHPVIAASPKPEDVVRAIAERYVELLISNR